jgi:hypothetical protein
LCPCLPEESDQKQVDSMHKPKAWF